MFPSLFQLGEFSMPTYGVLFSLAIMAGIWVSGRNFEQQGIDARKGRHLAGLVVLSGILGAKILAIINVWNLNSAHGRDLLSMLNWGTLQAGGVFSGGLVAALFAGFWYMRRNQLPALATADASAPGLALGHAIGRIGCFAAGCCWGKPTEAFWGMTFSDSLAHQWAGTPLGVPLVPTQLLESLAEFAIFFLLSWILRRRSFEGQVIAAYLFLYGLSRFGLEYFRDDPGRGSLFGGAISGTQLISILMIVTAAVGWIGQSISRRCAPRWRPSF
jgi:phosphatidylglycerol---prolipoprotein diacylglyceryl transferase